MARSRRTPRCDSRERRPIVGRRLIRLLDDQLRHLHRQPAHGNRVLRYDHVLIAHLLAFFNPTINSLRTLEDVFEHPRIQRTYRLPRVPRSTLSDAQRLFDPALLQPILDDLRRRVVRTPRDPGLDAITRQIIAVDASFFEVAGRIAWALPHNGGQAGGSVQLCLHFDAVHGTPVGFTLVGGQVSERAELPQALRAHCLYLLDRAYQSYAHLNQILALQSDFVVRMRNSAAFAVQEVRPLTAVDRLAGVQRDCQVTPSDRHHSFAAAVRLVEIFVVDEPEPVRLLTNRLDLPAATIGLLYRYRWQIELFFRWLKCVVGLRHFISESVEGMTIQLYAALIGTLLIAVETGSRPTKYDYAQMCLVAAGLITLEEARRVAAKRRAERARAAAWQREYQARRKTGR